MEPVYLLSVTVGGGCPYSELALRRAVMDRAGDGGPLSEIRHPPLQLMQATWEFQHAKHRVDAAHSRPCLSSVVWWRGDQKDGEHGTG